jgi:hypothetical protein
MHEVGKITGDTPLLWSRWPGRNGVRRVMPIHGKHIWRLCKTYGRLIGVPELKPHDLRHGVAMEVLEQHHDLEQVRALLGHTRIDTTQTYASIRPAQLKRGLVLRGQGCAHVERLEPLFQSRSGTGTDHEMRRGGTTNTETIERIRRENGSEFKGKVELSSNTEH